MGHFISSRSDVSRLYHCRKRRIPVAQLAAYLIENYEQLGYAIIKKKYGGIYPPQVSYGSVTLPWFTNNEIIKKQKTIILGQFAYSDCMEAAILNVINFIAYDTQTGTLKPIIPFFNEFNVQTINSSAAHNAWAGLISDVAGAEYNRRVKITEIDGAPVITIEKSKTQELGKPYIRPVENDGWYYYEIEPTLPNIVKVVNQIFNLNLRNFGEFLTHFNLRCGSYEGTEEEQRNTTCSITDKNKKTCTLSISPVHGEIGPYPEIAQAHHQEFATIKDLLLDNNVKALPLLNLYKIRIGYFIDFLDVNRQSSYMRHCLLIQPLADVMAETLILRMVGSKLSDFKNDLWYLNYIHKILQSLFSLNDPHTTIETLKIWAGFASSANMLEEFKKEYEQHFEDAQKDPQILANLLIFASQAEQQRLAQFVLSNFVKFDYENQYKTLKRFTDYKDIYEINPELIHQLLKIWSEYPEFNHMMFPLLLSAIVTLHIPSTISQPLLIQALKTLFNSHPNSFTNFLTLSKMFTNEAVKVLGVDTIKKIVSEILPHLDKKSLNDEIQMHKRHNKALYGADTSSNDNQELIAWLEEITNEA